MAALSDGKVDLDIKVCQLVRLFRAGEPVRMSKRAGTFVTLREVVDEVGRDPVRFMMLYRKNDAPLDFDLAKVVEQSKDNPVFYVQYAHARAKSVFRNVREAFPQLTAEAPEVASADLSLLQDAGEIELIRSSRPSPTSSRAPRAPTSRTASRSISMIWLQLFTRNGRRAMNCHICALSRHMTGL